ncbi:MAG TPA: DUF4920 domain-containing protein [Polyangiaceae bacterium]|jgi:hypothetical protein
MPAVHRIVFARAVAVAIVASLAAGCRSTSSVEAGELSAESAEGLSAGTETASKEPATEAQRFGGRFGGAEPAAFTEVLSDPDRFAGRRVVVEGHVRRACSRRGCWMELAQSPNSDSPACRVTFKDYGFFVPTDSAGAHAKVQGSVRLRTVSAARVQHLSEEGAKFRDVQPDGSAKELELVATAVELRRHL